MHIKAKEWDDKYGRSKRRNKSIIIKGEVTLVPLSRPCDRCGEIVQEGFIHEDCLLGEIPQLKDFEFPCNTERYTEGMYVELSKSEGWV